MSVLDVLEWDNIWINMVTLDWEWINHIDYLQLFPFNTVFRLSVIVKCTHCISVVCYWYYELNWGSMAHITFICHHLFLLSVLSHYTMFWHFVPLYIRFYVISIVIIALRHICYHLFQLSIQPHYEEYWILYTLYVQYA